MSELTCILCGTPETDRPLLAARFDKKDIHVCPGCIPTLIHGMPAPDMAQLLRERTSA
jgi:hypothetical protein